MAVRLPLLEFARLIASGSTADVLQHLNADRALATMHLKEGASRRSAPTFFLTDISHYAYAGDTALHIAAAAFRSDIAKRLVTCGADYRARNRRGAQPLHYAADANRWSPDAQARTIEYLLSVGADPNVVDRSGVAPLHRAVRTRSSAAVRALLEGGANPRQRNKSGSTPLHLAVQATGRGNAGSPQAREQQAAIVTLLLEHGAKPTDRDGRGRRPLQAASQWARDVLANAKPVP